MELKGRRVAFAIRDIYIPTPDVILADLHGDDVIAGEIVEVSNGGGDAAAYVVIRVDALTQLVVVPVARIRADAAE